MSHSTSASRKDELMALGKRNPDALMALWKDVAGIPGPVQNDAKIDFENVIIPAILKAEKQRAEENRKAASQ